MRGIGCETVPRRRIWLRPETMLWMLRMASCGGIPRHMRRAWPFGGRCVQETSSELRLELEEDVR